MFEDILSGGIFNQTIDILVYAVFGVVTVFFIVAGAVLNRHWKDYGINAKQIKRLRYTYFSAGVVFYITMLAGFIIFLV